jgi:membrane protein required for colicin V production
LHWSIVAQQAFGAALEPCRQLSDLSGVNWLTIVLAAVIGILTWRAYSNGFIRELVSLCVAILAIPIAGVFYDDLTRKINPIITDGTLARLVAFLSILVGVIIAGQVVAHLLKRAVAMLNLGALDHFAGGAFGFLKAVILCQVVLIALVMFPSPDLSDSIDASPVAKTLLDTAPAVLAFLPSTFDRGIQAFNDGIHAVGAQTSTLPTPAASH